MSAKTNNSAATSELAAGYNQAAHSVKFLRPPSIDPMSTVPSQAASAAHARTAVAAKAAFMICSRLMQNVNTVVHGKVDVVRLAVVGADLISVAYSVACSKAYPEFSKGSLAFLGLSLGENPLVGCLPTAGLSVQTNPTLWASAGRKSLCRTLPA